MGCDTLVQRKLGVRDPGPDVLFSYMRACAGDTCDPELLRVFVNACGPDVDWVITPVPEGGLGGQPLDEWEFSTPDDGMTGLVAPGLSIGSPTPMYWERFGFPADMEKRRVHWFKPNPLDIDPGDRHYAAYRAGEFGSGYGSRGGGGTGLWKPFEDELRRLPNVHFLMETSLVGLVRDEVRGVVGARVAGDGREMLLGAHRGVVVATGSFVGNRHLYERFTGRRWTYEEDPKSVVNGSPYNREQADGSGVLACLEAGVAPAFLENGNSGGLRINARAEALDADGRVIPGLYITSRAVGGLFNERFYPQCGAFVSSALCFGRIAGRNAAGRMFVSQ